MSHGVAESNRRSLSFRALMRQSLGVSSPSVPDVTVSGVSDDSRSVRPGFVFVAVSGHDADGHRYISEAISRGASVIVAQRSINDAGDVPVVVVPDTRTAAARLASGFFGLDDLIHHGRLRVVAVTGTNGKSTFCYLTRSVARKAGRPCALLGTIEYDLISRTIPATVTTPGPVALASHIAEAVAAGAQMVVMEASSHSLDQHRTDGLHFDVAVFTNLTGDHLDYHGNMDRYLLAKKRLFDGLTEDATAVLNVDDPASERIAEDCRAKRLTYGLNPLADVRARITEITSEGSRFDLITPIGSAEVRTQLVGRHNVANCLASASAGVSLGLSVDAIREGLESVTVIAGRLERVVRDGASGDPTVLVDYAHTDDALKNVLSALRPLTRGELTVIFGCGGDRDRTKRPRMASVAASYADRVVVTSDNPRTEPPEVIIEQIVSGFDSRSLERVTVEVDRKTAIARTIERAKEGDVVLIAGKGHETYQILGRTRVPFDDRAVALACLERRSRP